MNQGVPDSKAVYEALTPKERAELDSLLAAGHVPPLMEFIPATTPRYKSPLHLKPLIDELERSRTEPIRLVVACPPRFGKSESLLHFIAWILKQDPTRQIAYISHSDRVAKAKSRKARDIAESAGVGLARDAHSKADWQTGKDDGGVWATSVGGSLVGMGFHYILIDDPVHDRAAAESANQRNTDWDWFQGVAFNRLEPEGSIIVNMARWHEDDLSGRLIKQGWKYINLEAILPDGESLWPEQWPLARLMEIKAQSEYDWVSLYTGSPRPHEAQLFGSTTTYTELPKTLRFAIGIDCAYSAKTKADHSVACVLGEYDNKWYVIEIVRKQCKIDAFADQLLLLKTRYPTAKMRWHCSTTEMGSADLLQKLGVPISGVLATHDKYIRAQPVATRWNHGLVMVPQLASWLSDFVSELKDFNGDSGGHDDQVDALSSAFSLLPGKIIVREPAFQSPEWYAMEEEKMSQAVQRTLKSKQAAPWDPYGG